MLCLRYKENIYARISEEWTRCLEQGIQLNSPLT